MSKFAEYMLLREGKTGLPAEVKLDPEGEYKPFVVDEDRNPNLRVIVNAFLNSPNIALPGPDGFPQKMQTMDAKGVTSPKLKKKNLLLVGGAVRDHLVGKTPKDYDLATDATPDEIRLILRSAGFTETQPQTGKNAPKGRYDKHPAAGNKNKIFYAKGWDKAGAEFVIGAKVNGQEFEIATFRRDSKTGDGRTPDKMEFTPSFEEDSARRDFTINSMAIPLTTGDGPNSKLLDPHGGAHHLKNNEVKFVGDPKERLEEDQLRALRYVRFAARTGATGAVPQEYKDAIGQVKSLSAVSKERIRDEFVKGLEHADVDPIRYVRLYRDLGLLDTVFPGMTFTLDKPEDFSDKKDRRLAIAWILRANPPDKIAAMLAQGTYTTQEVNDIVHLVKMNGWADKYGRDEGGFYDGFYDMKTNQQRTGLVGSHIRQWGKMNGYDDDMLGHYMGHDLSVKGYVKDDLGGRSVNPDLVHLYGGRPPEGPEFGHGIRKLETEKFRDRFQK